MMLLKAYGFKFLLKFCCKFQSPEVPLLIMINKLDSLSNECTHKYKHVWQVLPVTAEV